MPFKAKTLRPLNYSPPPPRLSPKQRGYDAAHRQWRRAVLRRFPICRCGARASHADHVKPFHGLDDPLRLDVNNGRGLCVSCHSQKTAKYDHGFGNR